MTLLNTEQIGLAHGHMSTDDMYENLEKIADELGYTFDEIQENSVEELEHEFGIYGALEIMAEESDEEVFLDTITDGWLGDVIGAKVHVVREDVEEVIN